MKKLTVILAFVTLLIATAPACSAGTPQARHPVGGDFMEGQLGEDAQTLNWIVATDNGASRRYAGFMVDPLAALDNHYKVQLRCLARDIEVSPDGLTYTITLRNDLKWADGSRVTSEDYVYTIKNIMLGGWLDFPGKAKWQEPVGGKVAFVSAETVKDDTFRIVRKTVAPDFLYTLYDLMPYPKYIAIHYENKPDQFTNAPEFNNLTYSGNMGPYLPVGWSVNSRFTVKRNPDYYLGKETGAPYFKSYSIRIFAVQQLMEEALRQEELSYAYVSPDEANSFRSQSGNNVYTVPTGFYVYLAYNLRDNGWEGLKDVRVRQAISMMINKPTIVQELYQGFADPAFSFVPPYSPWYDESVLRKYGMDPGKDQQTAIDLIKSAGYEQKEIDGRMRFVDKNGNAIKLNFPVDMGSDFEQNLAIVIRQCVLNIGLDINPKFSTREVIFADALMNKKPGSEEKPTFNNGPGAVGNQPWDLAILSSHANGIAMEASGEFFTTTGRFNLTGFYNTRVDALYQKLKSADGVNPDNRKKIYSELAQIISDAQPADFLVYYKDNECFSNKIKGVEPGINMLYNYQFWYSE